MHRRWVEWTDTTGALRAGLYVADLGEGSVIVETFLHRVGPREVVVPRSRLGVVSGEAVEDMEEAA